LIKVVKKLAVNPSPEIPDLTWNKRADSMDVIPASLYIGLYTGL
jgi:hypothetical protein